MISMTFDLDGTLLDTLADIGNACNYILSLNGYPVHPLCKYRQMVGNGFKTLMMRALPEDYDLGTLDNIVKNARTYYAENMMRETKPYDGITSALKNLENKGVILSVLSNKPDELTKKLVLHYFKDISFFRIYGGRENFPLKPDPAVLKDIIKQINANVSFYIGDSDVDMQTAIAAGCCPVGVAWGFRSIDELKKAGAKNILHKSSELVDLI